MSEAINETLQYIDSVIEAIISDMIMVRAKLLEASQKILDKIKSLMEATTYTYRLGDLLDKAVKIETDMIKQSDISKPRISIKYTGAKTTLFYNGYEIQVPEIPVFVYEPTNVDKGIHEMGIEMIKKNVVLKFPLEANISESPDFENAYGKYYFLEYEGVPFDYCPLLLLQGIKVSVLGFAFELDHLESTSVYRFARELTINGTKHRFELYVYFGKLIGHRYIDPSTTIENIAYPCTLFDMLTPYGGRFYWIIFGNEVIGNVKIDTYYERTCAFIYAVDTPLFYVLR